MFRYFKAIRNPNLPNPEHHPSHGLDPAAVRAANEKVEEVLNEEDVAGPSSNATSAAGNKNPTKRCGVYGVYTPEIRAKIGRYAAENGVAAAQRKFAKEFEKTVNESTIRGMKSAYLKLRSANPTVPVDVLPKATRGRPLVLGKYDEDVQSYIKAIRKSGGIISSKIVIAGAVGLLKKKQSPVLVEHGGDVTLDKTWARSILDRMGYTKRKGTKGVKNRPADFEEISGKFYRRIGRRVRKYNIPDALIINWDQTGVDVVPANDWTMHEKGAKQVAIKGSDDKRQYTSLLACSLDGDFLPPQILYQGKTVQCHARADFPKDWDIWHTESHWSNSDSMIRYLDTIIRPYIEHTREHLGNPDARPLLIFDVFRAHRTEEVRKKIEDMGALFVYVPAACTDELQPLDATVNSQYKRQLNNQFNNRYSNKVAKGIEDGLTMEEIAKTIDLRTSAIKPHHATWLMRAHDILHDERDLIIKGFQNTGILKAVADARMEPVPDYDDSDAEGWE